MSKKSLAVLKHSGLEIHHQLRKTEKSWAQLYSGKVKGLKNLESQDRLQH